MATRVPLTRDWAEVAADITAVTLVQVPYDGGSHVLGVELIDAAEAPAATVRGVQLVSGETMNAEQLAVVGASDGLYGRVAWGADTGAVLILPDA